MNVSVYQVNFDRDKKAVAFDCFEEMKRHGKQENVDPSIYDKVFEGNLEAKDLEDVFRILNVKVNEVTGYRGHSLSVSDVVEVKEDTEEVQKGFYFCDRIGFKNIEFDPAKTQEVKHKSKSRDER